MSLKFDTLPILNQFFVFVSTHFQTKIQTIQIDNATDLFKLECKTYFTSLGIVHRALTPIALNKMMTVSLLYKNAHQLPQLPQNHLVHPCLNLSSSSSSSSSW